MTPATLFKRDPPLGGSVAELEQHLSHYFANEEKIIAPIRSGLPAVFIFVGPKGCGKTAIQRWVCDNPEAVPARPIQISPNDIALWSLTRENLFTSTSLSKADDRFITKTLWNFLIATEMLRREYQTIDSVWQKMFSAIFRRKSESTARVKRLLERGAFNDAKISLTQQFVELLDELQTELVVAEALGASLAAKTGKPISRPEAGSILHDLQHVVDNIGQLVERKYIILIDDLDQDWSNRYSHRRLIEGLIASALFLGRSGVASFVIAIRDDIFSRLELDDREKVRNVVRELSWSKAALEDLLLRRISWATGRPLSTVSISLLFPAGLKTAAYWACAAGNPRRAIQIAEHIIGQSAGLDQVDEHTLKASVSHCSAEFLLDLDSQYRSTYPGLRFIAQSLKDIGNEFGMDEFQAFLDKIAYRLNQGYGKEYLWLRGMFSSRDDLARILLECGLLLYKDTSTARPRPYNPGHDEIMDSTCFAVNPAYAYGLGVSYR